MEIKKIKNKLTVGTALLIIFGLIVITYTSIVLYKTYTQDSQIKQALQLAKDENRMIEFTTSNGAKAAYNLSSKNGFSAIPKHYQMTRVIVYPKNYKVEYYKAPGSNQIITPYKVDLQLF